MPIEFVGPLSDDEDDEMFEIAIDGATVGKLFPELELVTLSSAHRADTAEVAEAVKANFEFTPDIEIVD